jgi:uncharacterized protein (DUF952 family)/ribosomal protein S18 acetylase RimI-like enzyme
VSLRKPDVIYHITAQSKWPTVDGGPLVAESLATEGFVHASSWAQLPRVTGSLFAGRTDLVVLEIDATLLPGEPVWEDLYNLGQTFPHIYAPVPPQTVVGELTVTWDETGAPRFGRPWFATDHASPTWRALATPEAELDLLARFNSELIEDEGSNNRLDRSELRSRMAGFLRSGYEAWILDVASHPAGYAILKPNERPLHLRQYFIDRGLRRAGLGARAFVMLQRDLGAESLTLDVLADNTAATRFWHSLGFADRYVRMEIRPDSGGAPEGAAASAPGHHAAEPVMTRIAGDDRPGSFLKERIRSLNDAVSRYHRASRDPGAIMPIAVMLNGPGGTWIGGVSGHTFWNWLEVDDFWIEDEFRGQGWGGQLLLEIEEMARSRGAEFSKLTTFSFQAREFYEKKGYEVVGCLEGYPPGASYFWLRKTL